MKKPLLSHITDPFKNNLHREPRWSIYVIIALIALANFITMMLLTGIKPLGYDDTYQISIALQTTPGDFFRRLINGDNMPPLYAFLMYPWLHLVPRGTFWLRLPSEIFVSLGVVLCGIIGLRLRGKYCGILSALFAATSFQVMQRGGFCFRPYGLFFLLSCLTILVFWKRREQADNRKWTLLYTLSLIGLSYSHYFGVLLVMSLFFYEVLLMFLKSSHWKLIFPYITAGILYIPWLIPVAIRKITVPEPLWAERPGGTDFVLLYLATLNYNWFYFFLYLITGCILVFLLGKALWFWLVKKDASRFTHRVLLLFFLYWMPFFQICVMYILPRIKPDVSLWGERYFIGMMPYAFLTLGVIFDEFLTWVRKPRCFTAITRIAFVLLAVVSFYSVYIRLQTFEQVSNEVPYEYVARYLEESDLSEPSVLAISGNGDYPTVWNYYFGDDYQHLATKVMRPGDILEDISIMQPIEKVYLFYNHLLNDDIAAMLENEFRVVETIPDYHMTIYERVH